MTDPVFVEVTNTVIVSEDVNTLITDSDNNIVLETTSEVTILTEGLQGPVGPQGPSGENAIYYFAAVSVSGHQAVVLNDEGNCLPADASNATHFAVAGITTHAAGQGVAVLVLARSTIEHLGWTFTPGLPVYLGLGGAVTQMLPTEALFSKVLGIATSATRISIDLQPAIFK